MVDYSKFEDLNVSRETFDRLVTYVDLVKRWNPKINLVSRNSLERIWDRHILDSVQVCRCADRFDTWARIHISILHGWWRADCRSIYRKSL